jgi:4-diphosphocytidyl-2-C-methyl-D-erythritol kinase
MKANAKINLFLHIVGKDNNNYHLLESMVMFAEDIYDLVEIEPSKNLQLDVVGEFSELLVKNNDNILYKLIALLNISNQNTCKIKLTKNIPIAAGVGGGSADAATALKILLKQWNISLSPDQIKELCLKLGADVYCCYHQLPLYFSGIGEIIEPMLKMPKLYAVLVNPLKTISTKEIFSHYPKNNYRAKLINKPYLFNSTNELIFYISKQYNDLELVTASLIPEINVMKTALLKQNNCLLARMSGTGASCFGLYPTISCAVNAAEKIKQQYKSWWVRPTILSEK